MQPGDEPRSKASTLTRLFEYAIGHAIKENEIAEHEGQTVLHCWADAEQMQDTDTAGKEAKFKRSLNMKFGPAKGNSVFDNIIKRKNLAIKSVQEKQLQKRQQMQQGDISGPPSVGSSQDTMAGGYSFSQEQAMPTQQFSSATPPMHPTMQVPIQMPMQNTMQNPVQPMLQPGMQPVMQQQHYTGAPASMAGSAPHQQQQQYNTMPSMQQGVTNLHQQQQQQQQQLQQPQHGVLNTFNPLPNGMTGLPPPQLGGPHLLAPISHMSGPDGQPMLMQGGYGMGNMNGGGNLNIGPNSSNNGNGNGLNMRPAHMSAPGTMPGPGGVPQQQQQQNTMIYNTNGNYPPRPNFTPGMVNNPAAMANASAMAAAKKATAATKRGAGAAGLDDADRKGAKKKATAAPGMQQGQAQGQMGGMPGMGMPGRGMPGQQQQQMGIPVLGGAAGQVGGVNRPLNVPGGFYAQQSGNPNNSGGGQSGAAGNAPPLTMAQEIDRDTERPNSVQEGLEPAGEFAVVAPLVTPDFVRMQNDLARERLRMGLPGAPCGATAGMAGGLSQQQQQQSSATMMRALNIPGAPSPDEQPWLMLNVVDRGMMGRAVQRVLDGSSTKIGVHSLNMVSNAVQRHLKNVLEAAFKVAKSRVNKTAFNSYDGISKMIVEHGRGSALPENQQNIGIRWAEDVQGALQAEEAAARQTLKQYDAALEESLVEKMRAADEERGKAGNKRRTGTAEADTAWWTKEDGAEKAGLLGWEDLAMTGFKAAVASRHELGNFALTSKAKSRASMGSSASGVAGAGGSAATSGSGSVAAVFAGVGNGAAASSALPVSAALEAGAVESAAPAAAGAGSVVADWANQPCPLVMPRAGHPIVIQDEDLAMTLARSTHNRGLPDTILSGVRPTGSCLYKCKMGLYTGNSANP